MKKLIIGDIHGCYDELMLLIDKANLSDNDQIIALGDIVDRGPDTLKVLDFFRNTPNTTSLKGNHERKHVNASKGLCKAAASQLFARKQIGEENYDDALEYMDSLPNYIDLPEALLVHGFYEPGIKIVDQQENVIVGTMSGEFYLKNNYDKPWYELYDGIKPLIVGHLNYLHTGEPLIYNDKVFCIDTGAVRGGNLTGLILPEFKLISVKSKKDYWQEALKKNKKNALLLLVEYFKDNPDPEYWNLDKVRQLESYSESDSEAQDILKQLYEHIAAYDFQQKLEDARESLFKQFGQMPESGPARGEYFKALNSKLDPSLKILLNYLVRHDEFYADVVFSLNLKNIHSLLNQLEEINKL